MKQLTEESEFRYTIFRESINFNGDIEGTPYRGYVEVQSPYTVHIIGGLSKLQRQAVEQRLAQLLQSLGRHATEKPIPVRALK